MSGGESVDRLRQAAALCLDIADARDLPLPDESVDLIVTSPPYFGLRAYGAGEDEIGQETRLDEYLDSLMMALREMGRVLRPTGSAFIVIGDKYVSDNRGSNADRKREHKHAPAGAGGFVGRDAAPKGSLLGIPFRLALAAVDTGWYWRQEIVWHKPNPTPDPTGRDRCARSHETILHLTRSRHYTVNPQVRQRGHDVWDYAVEGYRDPAGRKHPAVFPAPLVRAIVNGWSRVNDVVLDPFVGSGTTPAVALPLGRRAIGFDLNAEFLNIARDRCRPWSVEGPERRCWSCRNVGYCTCTRTLEAS